MTPDDHPVAIEKEWAAVRGDEILLKRPTKRAVQTAVARGEVAEPYEIVALPKNTGWVF